MWAPWGALNCQRFTVIEFYVFVQLQNDVVSRALLLSKENNTDLLLSWIVAKTVRCTEKDLQSKLIIWTVLSLKLLFYTITLFWTESKKSFLYFFPSDYTCGCIFAIPNEVLKSNNKLGIVLFVFMKWRGYSCNVYYKCFSQELFAQTQ